MSLFHSTNPDIRAYMLNNPKAKNIVEDLKWLNEIDIPIHVQIVLCPEINDKLELERTLNDLARFKSNIFINSNSACRPYTIQRR